jgi:hypothetical protein
MNGRQFGPGKPGSRDAARQHREASSENQERRLTGPRAALQVQYKKMLYTTDDNIKTSERQAYPIRLLKQRYGLSYNYAAFVAAEFRWEGA